MPDEMPLFESLEDVDAQALRVREHEATVKDAQQVLEEAASELHTTQAWATHVEALEALKEAKADLARARRALTAGCMSRVGELEQAAVS